jgi:hypothetical protein
LLAAPPNRLGPRWNISGRRESQPLWASYIISETTSIVAAIVCIHQSLASSAFQCRLTLVTLLGTSRPSVLHWHCIICPPGSEVSRFLDWAATGFSGSWHGDDNCGIIQVEVFQSYKSICIYLILCPSTEP